MCPFLANPIDRSQRDTTSAAFFFLFSLSHTFTHLCILIDIFISRFAKKESLIFYFSLHFLAYIKKKLYLCNRKGYPPFPVAVFPASTGTT